MINSTAAGLGWASVALALIPEAIGFAVIAGVDPKVGLYASVVIACVIAFAGGRPAMISAATAAAAVVMGPLVKAHGLPYLLGATLLMGLADRCRVVPPRAHHALRVAVGHDRLR